MSLKLQAVEQQLITLLALHERLVKQNRDIKSIKRCQRKIRRLLRIYEAGTAGGK